jgi:AraC-like DNA-binding protein
MGQFTPAKWSSLGGQGWGSLSGRRGSIAVTFSRWATNREDLNPLWVSFKHAKPADVRCYEGLFRCELRFGSNETAIGANAELAELRLPQANPQVRLLMEDLCNDLVKQLGNALEPGWLASARRSTILAIQQGVPSSDEIAKAIGLHPEQFKLLLASRGLSFRALLDDLRHALALRHMQDSSLSLVDIAYLLGFSEQSSFQRAFKRWSGFTPGDYRKRVRMSSASLQCPKSPTVIRLRL